MRLVRIKNLIGIGVMAGAIAALSAYSVSAGESARAHLKAQNKDIPNMTFLVDLKRGTAPESQAINDKLLDTKTTNRIKQEYIDMNRDYDMRTKFHLLSSMEQQSYFDRNSGFTKYYLRNIMSFQVSEGWKKAEKHSDEIRTFRKTQASVQKVMENPVDVTVDEQTKFGTHTDLPGERGQVWLKSRLVDGTFDVILGPGFNINPMNQVQQQGDFTKEEHYRLSLNKDLGLWGLAARSSYAFDSTRINHAVSKSIVENLSAEVAYNRGIDPAKSGLSQKGEPVVRMMYGLSF